MPTAYTFTGPGNGVITDDAATAITTILVPTLAEQHIAYMAVLTLMRTSLASTSVSTSKINDNVESIAKNLAKLDASISVLSSAATTLSTTQAMLAANQIKTNNFQMQVTKEALQRADLPEPTLPDFKEQLKEAVKDGIEFNISSTINGATTAFLNSTVKTAGEMIAATAIYKQAAALANGLKDNVLSILPESVRTAAVRAQNAGAV